MRKAPLLRPTKTRSPALESAQSPLNATPICNVHTMGENSLNFGLVPLPELDDRAGCEGREHGAGQLEADGTTGNRIASESARQESTKVVEEGSKYSAKWMAVQ